MRDITLTGVGWAHERCMGPLYAAAAAWQELRPEVSVRFTERPLVAFNDQPIEELVAGFDLLVIDHPFVGTGAAAGYLAPLDDLAPAGALEALAADSIGASHASYRYAGRQWALAVDAACHVSVVREDLIERAGRCAPETWEAVLSLARDLPGRVAIPLYPTDAVCCLLTVCASLGSPVAGGVSLFAGREAGEGALSLLAGLVPFLHPDSFALNPPQALDRMRDTDEIVHIPLAFGYTNYSRPGWGAGPCLRFLDIPSAGRGPVGSVLGGAGLAVSASSRYRREAAEFAAWLSAAEPQARIVFPAGGQPASRSVWDDLELDAVSGGFFSGTRASIEAAHVRPRERWWPRFQADAGELVAHLLREGVRPSEGVAELERLYRSHRAATVAA